MGYKNQHKPKNLIYQKKQYKIKCSLVLARKKIKLKNQSSTKRSDHFNHSHQERKPRNAYPLQPTWKRSSTFTTQPMKSHQKPRKLSQVSKAKISGKCSHTRREALPRSPRSPFSHAAVGRVRSKSRLRNRISRCS